VGDAFNEYRKGERRKKSTSDPAGGTLDSSCASGVI
jgi:hypothetical protein